MTGEDEGPLRLCAVAALMDVGLGASREADAWIGLDGEPCSENEAGLIVSATGAERRLAEALRGSPGMELPEPDADAIAALLRLARGWLAAGDGTHRRLASEVPDSGRLMTRSGSWRARGRVR